MRDIVIRADRVSKRYRINRFQRKRAVERSLRDDLMHALDFRKRDDNAFEIISALNDVSFEVKSGEVLGVIGRNGAGKSTLLKILSRITKPTEGTIDLHGRVGSLLEVGTGFHAELSGRENIYLNGAILGMGKREIDRKFDEIVAFSEVEKFIDTPVKRYSSGMYMRLAFSVAAHLDPEILIVDEVLAVGDVQFQKKCLGKMGEVARGGRTVLFVSHNMNAIEQLCTSAMLLDEGRIRECNSDVRKVITSYLSDVGGNEQQGEWVNGGDEFDNPYFKPLRFRIVDNDRVAVNRPINRDETVWVEIEGEIKKVNSVLAVGYVIYTDSGVQLFQSYHTDTSPETWPSLKPGRCVLRSKLPVNLLNEGAYRLECVGDLFDRHWLFAPGEKVPCLQLEVQGGLSKSPYWARKRHGVFAPVIEWETLSD